MRRTTVRTMTYVVFAAGALGLTAGAAQAQLVPAVPVPPIPVTPPVLPAPTIPPATVPSIPVTVPHVTLPVTVPTLPKLPVTLPATLPSLPVTLPSIPIPGAPTGSGAGAAPGTVAPVSGTSGPGAASTLATPGAPASAVPGSAGTSHGTAVPGTVTPGARSGTTSGAGARTGSGTGGVPLMHPSARAVPALVHPTTSALRVLALGLAVTLLLGVGGAQVLWLRRFGFRAVAG